MFIIKDSPVIGGHNRGESLWFGANNKLLQHPDNRVLPHKHNQSQLHVGMNQVTLTHQPTKCSRRTGAPLTEALFAPTVHSQVSWHDNKHLTGRRNCYSKSNKCDRPSQCLVVRPRDTANDDKRKYIWKKWRCSLLYVCKKFDFVMQRQILEQSDSKTKWSQS